MTSYQQYRPSMKTGDVIAFSGKGRISNLIKFTTRSSFSHMGMVVNTVMERGFGQSILIVESTTLSDIPDAQSGKMVKGVQMHWLSQRLSTYKGKVWWVPLKQAIPQEKIPPMLHWIRTIHENQTEYDTVQAIGSALDLFDMLGFSNKQDYQTLFCSELITHAFQIAGLVPDTINPSECTPQDVIEFSFLEKPIRLQ